MKRHFFFPTVGSSEHERNKGSRRNSDDDFKNKYPFNLFSFISCRLKTLMKQFFKLKWFIFSRRREKKNIFVFHPTSRKPVRCGWDWLCFWGQSERQIEGNKIFISSCSTRRVNDEMKISTWKTLILKRKTGEFRYAVTKNKFRVLKCFEFEVFCRWNF